MVRRTDDPEYREWIKTLPCARLDCRQTTVTECHHFKHDLHLSGTSRKAPDWMTMPLCWDHHLGPEGFHANHREQKADQREWLIRTLMKAKEAGMLVRTDGMGVEW